MSGFLTPCILKNDPVDDGIKTLVSPLVYQSDAAGMTFTVPAGFRTDGASVPRCVPLAYALFGNTSEEAAALHDYLYTAQPVSRAMADRVLLEASQATDVPGWRRWPMWLGVRVFGASHWSPVAAGGAAPPAAGA